MISSIARAWAPVRGNGNPVRKRSTSSGETASEARCPTACTTPVTVASRSALAATRASCTRRSSSNTSLDLALVMWPIDSGA